ncbi:bifunctional serine/threonine-protein kinase/formylglycine-generating enzyme family protein [Marinimicrobium sp. LS-A18]|uniref:bifunctional serine/threonine-protein kinase/formylglycine-generating enzyme family protein n=1 Tax=Marinimicrobium sp. LS-A18 TaxID=1381596 RepID=UPI0009DB78E0|nr:bifunctional serine/threonine-protein kinase/formylglycine-generating enzyme family protein [Marinimicrobium sp. LS-A18]
MTETRDTKTRIAPRAKTPPDATVYTPRSRSEETPAASDRTRYQAPPRRRGSDATLVDPNPPTVVARPTKPKAAASPKRPSGHHGLLKRRFLLEDILGAGGMGVVYKAKDRLKIEAQDRDPYVAIKVLSDEFKAHPEAFIALQRESRKTQRIAHPNIVNVHDFDRDGDTVFMTMEFLDGKPLDKLLSQYRSTGLPHEDCLKILEGVCSALIYAHAENIIHSDLKPGNIFVTHRGIPKVFDFGIARAVAKAERSDDSEDDKTVFDAGNLGALTPAYASLEMLEGAPPDARDDLYALGCIAYELFAGEHPFNRVHADEAARQKLKPKRLVGIPKSQWRAIEHCLAFRREDRVASVQAFWNAFVHRKVAIAKYAIGALIVVTSMATAAYQYRDQWIPQFSEQDVRMEIEQRLRLEMKQNELTELLTTLTFSSQWERQLWQSYTDLRDLLGESDQWLEGQRASIYKAYLEKIDEEIEAGALEQARARLTNARRYSDDEAALDRLSAQIDSALERARLEAEQQAEARRAAQALAQEQARKQAVQEKVNREFDNALANVDRQLACRQQLNMDDLAIAVNKLQELDPGRYQREQSRMIGALASCIETIGARFPDRAQTFKQHAMQIFPRSAAIAGIAIEPKDPCDASLAGMGGRGPRAGCRDTLPGAGLGPDMVVVPGFAGRPAYAIGREEVTVGDFNRFCRASTCEVQQEQSRDRPVTDISIEQAKAYARWLSEQTGYRYRLPTYEEWRHAARADGAEPDPNRNCLFSSRGIQRGGSMVKASVGGQNRWGLVNHLGNAQEWVLSGGALSVAGGHYDTSMDECQVSWQKSHDGHPDTYTGLRLVRQLKNR